MTHLVISNHTISQDKNGFFSLNDLHKASGNENRHEPNRFMRNQQTQDLICAIEKGGQVAYHTVKGNRSDGTKQGTFVRREIVIAYGMWINADFHLAVIRAFDNLNTGAIPCLQKTTVDDRTPLRQAVSLLVGKKGLAYDTAYNIVHQYMGVSHIDEIPLDDLPKAISYVHHLIVGNATINDSIHHLVWHTAHIYRWYKAREEAFYALSPQIASSVHEHIISAKAYANRLHRTLELTFDPDYPRRLV